MVDRLDAPALLRLLQLASPTLPVGAYAYSQGLEWAVEAGWVHDEASLADWLRTQLVESFARVDLPIFSRLYTAARASDDEALRHWSRQLLALRETRELIAGRHARLSAARQVVPRRRDGRQVTLRAKPAYETSTRGGAEGPAARRRFQFGDWFWIPQAQPPPGTGPTC